MILLFIQNIAGWIWAHKKLVAGAVGAIVLVVLVALAYRSCGKSPSLNQEEIIKAQQAIEKEDRKKMVEILAESDVREQAIDNSIKAAEEATEQAKKSYADKSNAELAAELERRLKGE